MAWGACLEVPGPPMPVCPLDIYYPLSILESGEEKGFTHAGSIQHIKH
jgi:hypothetical protein